MDQPDIHTSDNLELSFKLSSNNLNVALFKNQRLQRIKPRQKLSEPAFALHHIQPQTDTKVGRGSTSHAQTSTHPATNYQNNFRTSTHYETQQRAQTSNTHARNFRKRTHDESRKSKHNSFSQKPTLKNNFMSIEKKHNKGPLEVKNLQNWLNDILVEYCYEEKFDATIQNPALKKFQIDRNSLLSKGISHGEIDRVYRSLFVYSIGFNRLLEELASTSQSSAIRKSLWRVYAMLLEYCAKGEFQTMVGQIERDKLRKLDVMKQQIQRRQQIIDTSEQLDKQKHVKMYKQIKELKQQNTNLLNEKAIIEEDFKQADQAFNQQVGLRLKFQHKINQIHGIHRQLGIKHMRLLEDFNNHKQQYSRLMQQKARQIERIEGLRVQAFDLQAKIDQLKLQLNDKNIAYENAQYNLEVSLGKVLLLEGKLTQNASGEIEKDREITLLKFEINNLQGKLALRQKSLKEHYTQVQVLINQNRGMYQKMQQQKYRIQQLIKEQYNFQLASINLKTRQQLMTEKYLEKAKQFDDLKSKHSIAKEDISRLESELNLALEKNKLYLADIDNYNSSIEVMKKAKNVIEDQMNDLKRQNANIMEVLQGKVSLENQLSKKLAELQEEYNNTKTALFDLEGKYKYAESTFAHEKNLLTKKYQKAKAQRQEFARVDKERAELMAILTAENQKCKLDEAQAKTQLRDEIFQRSNLELKYKQSLLVMEDQNKYIKQLNITMSHLKQEKDTIQRKLKSTEFVLAERTQQWKSEVAMLTQQIRIHRVELDKKRAYVHPMYFHDLEARCFSTMNKYLGLEMIYQGLIKKIKDMQIEFQNKLKETVETLEKQRKDQLEAKDQQIFLKQKQVEHQKEKLVSSSKKISELEKHMKSLEKSGGKDDPKILLLQKTVKEKQEKVEDLAKQNQGLQDRNAQLNKKLIVTGNQLEDQKKTVMEYKEVVKQIEKKMEVQAAQFKQVLLVTEQEYKKQLDEQQEVYNSLVTQLQVMKQELPQRRPPTELRDSSSNKQKTQQSKQEDKLSWVRKSQQSSHTPGVHDDKSFSQKQDSRQYEREQKSLNNLHQGAPLSAAQQQQQQKQRIAELKRREIARKLKGAFNYYHNIK